MWTLIITLSVFFTLHKILSSVTHSPLSADEPVDIPVRMGRAYVQRVPVRVDRRRDRYPRD